MTIKHPFSHITISNHIYVFSSQVEFIFLSAVSLVFPVPVAQGADAPGLEPPGDAVEVEGVVAHPPGHCALLAGGAGLVGLTLDAQVHDVVPADGAVVHHDVPGPQRARIQLLHLEPARAGVPLCHLGLGGPSFERGRKPFFGIWI